MMANWQSKLSKDPSEWLLNSTPWTRYNTLTQLLGQHETSPDVAAARAEMLAHPQILSVINDANDWFRVPPTRHDDSKMSHYKLKMLADFGLTISDGGISGIVEKAKEHTENGLFCIKQALPEKGNFNVKIDADFNEWHALPCDSILISSILYKLGDRSAVVQESVQSICSKWDTEIGWFCHLFFVESQFKKCQMGCPMAGLHTLELLSLLKNVDPTLVRNAYSPLKYHRELGKSLYYFGRSKKFWSLKYPYVWYNALYIADVLTRFNELKGEPLVEEIVEWIVKSQTSEGTFIPTSMFMEYKGWDFSNKKEPSPWLTFLCCKILKQYFG